MRAKEITSKIKEETDLTDGMASILGLIRLDEVESKEIPEAVREAINSEGVEGNDVFSVNLRTDKKKTPLGLFIVVGRWGTPDFGEVLAAFSEDGDSLDLRDLEHEGILFPRMAEPEDAEEIKSIFRSSEKAKKAIVSASKMSLWRMGIEVENGEIVEINQ